VHLASGCYRRFFLSGTGTVYSCWQKSRDEANAKAEHARAQENVRLTADLERRQRIADTIDRLDLEISYRYSQALMELNTIRKNTKNDRSGGRQRSNTTVAAVVDVLQSLSRPPRSDQTPLFPEYASYGLPTFLGELRRIAPAEEQSNLDGTLGDVVGLRDKAVFKTADPATEAGAWIQTTIRTRWRKSWFFYVDCSPQNPFC